MRKRFICLTMAVLLLASLALNGCAAKTSQGTVANPNKITVTDMEGRKLEINAPVNRVVAIGSAMRLYCYIDGINTLVGVEKAQQTSPTDRPYILANPGLKDLPIIGNGFPAEPDAEMLATAKPDVIFAGDIVDKAGIEQLQTKTGIPVIALTGMNDGVFDQKLYQALNLIGVVMGKAQRSKEIVDYMEAIKQDMNRRTKDVPDNKKPTVYVGALSWKGIHGIESTLGNYPELEVLNAKNVADVTGKSGSVTIDKEKLIQWNPDKIIIDEGGYQLVKQDYQKNPSFYNNLKAVKNGEVYGQLPYVAYYDNLDTALADIYYVGKVLYPDQFQDIDPVKKVDEIYKFLLGKELYSQMAKDYGGFMKLTLP